MSDIAKAQDLISQAEKKVKGSLMSMFGSGSSRFEEAAELFEKAANTYKLAKKWEDAAASYCKAAECYLKLKSNHEAAQQLINASNCYKKTQVSEAIVCLGRAINMYTEDGRFSIAAKHQKEIAELYEAELDTERAMDAYQQAADFYDGEGSSSSTNQCLLKVAQFAAQLEKYDKAVELFEKVARSSLENNLLKWSVKDYFVRAAICILCNEDFVDAQRAVDRYKEWDPSFASQKEFKFLEDLIKAVEEKNIEEFTAVVVEFDSLIKLDQWKTSMLLKIKNTLKSEEEKLA